jgi:hypothetical protein
MGVEFQWEPLKRKVFPGAPMSHMPHKLAWISFILWHGSIEVVLARTTFDFVFTDASGLSDTVTLGIDSAATDSLDAELGEVNIKDSAVDSFEVRFVGRTWDYTRNAVVQTWASKMQFVNPDCSRDDIWSTTWYALGIYSKHWPITVDWDSSRFTGVCPNGGGITGYVSDVVSRTSLRPTRFDTISSVTFTSHQDPALMFSALNVKPDGVDTAEVFYFTLATKLKVGLGIQTQNRLRNFRQSNRWFGSWQFEGRDFLGRRVKSRMH